MCATLHKKRRVERINCILLLLFRVEYFHHYHDGSITTVAVSTINKAGPCIDFESKIKFFFFFFLFLLSKWLFFPAADVLKGKRALLGDRFARRTPTACCLPQARSAAARCQRRRPRPWRLDALVPARGRQRARAHRPHRWSYAKASGKQ